MADEAWRPLGEILVERGLLDRYELAHWLTQQKLSGMLLGELLVMHHIVSPVEVAAALAIQRGSEHVAEGIHDAPGHHHGPQHPQGLGRMLVDKELLTESGLQRALLAQRRKGGSLGDILVERGYVAREQIEAVRAEQNGDEVAPASRLHEPAAGRYEVLVPFVEEPVHVSDSFLDATDLAFDLIDRDDPHALEIVRVKGAEREQVWSYSREASERYREANAELG